MEITPEIQAAIDAAVEAATAGLKTKNAELINREKAAKKAADDAEAARDEAASEAAAKAGDIEAIKAQLTKKHEAELKRATDANAALNGQLATLLIDNEIKTAITANNVLPHFAPAVTALLKSGAELRDGQAMNGDISLTDHIAAFMKSADAAHYISAPQNSGAGAQGSTQSGNSNAGFTKETLTLTEFSKLALQDPAKANSIAASVGSDFRA